MIGYALQLFAHILPAALCRLSVFGYIFNSLHVRELLQVLKKVKKAVAVSSKSAQIFMKGHPQRQYYKFSNESAVILLVPLRED